MSKMQKMLQTVKKSLMIGFMIILCGCQCVAWGEEQMTLEDLGISTALSYKNPGENNPLYTQRFGADPGVMEYAGRVYVYMTDDQIEYDATGRVQENSYGKIQHINCISSADMVNWTDHGRIPVAGPQGIASWANNSWAPCAAHKEIDGREKFFLYFCNGGNGIGVLTADSPVGPWRDELGHLLITRATPNCADVLWLFDPAVFVDEDGTGYLAFGGGVPEGKLEYPGTGRIVRLSDDMLSLDMEPISLEVPWFFEDSGINRMGDTYIYSYCSNWQTEGNTLGLTSGAIEYMTANDPLGPYTYAGELFLNEGRFFGLYGNNHHSIACLEGEYYLFYHSRPVEQAMGITGNYRSPQVNQIQWTGEGQMKSVIGTMAGAAQLHPLNPKEPVSGATFSHEGGITVEGEGSQTWSHGQPGSWFRISGADFGENGGTITIQYHTDETCELYLLADSLQEPVAARVELAKDANSVQQFINLQRVRDIYFVFGGDAAIDSWVFSGNGASLK